MQLSTMRLEARQILGQTDTAHTNISESQLTTWANLAYGYIIGKTRDIPITERSYSTPAGATPTVTLNANTITVDRAKIYVRPDNFWQELEIVDVADLMRRDPDWENADVGVPELLVRMGTFSARLYPPPNASIASQATSLKTYGLEHPTSLAADGDLPDLPVILQNLFPHYMAARGFAFLADEERSALHFRYFYSGVKDVLQISQKFSDQRVKWKFERDEMGQPN